MICPPSLPPLAHLSTLPPPHPYLPHHLSTLPSCPPLTTFTFPPPTSSSPPPKVEDSCPPQLLIIYVFSSSTCLLLLLLPPLTPTSLLSQLLLYLSLFAPSWSCNLLPSLFILSSSTFIPCTLSEITRVLLVSSPAWVFRINPRNSWDGVLKQNVSVCVFSCRPVWRLCGSSLSLFWFYWLYHGRVPRL